MSAKRESFLDLDDYGVGDLCGRVRVYLEFEGPSDYLVDLEDIYTKKDVIYSKLSKRDQAVVDKWVAAEVKDILEYAADQTRDY